MATNVDAKLLKQTKFPAEFSQKVDMKKVNVEVMKKLTPKKLLKRLKSAKSKNAPAKETLTTCDRESGLTAGEVEEEAKEHTTITIGVLQGFQGLHLLAGALHLTETTTVVLRAVISRIPISLETEATERVGTIRADGGHRHRGGLCAGPYLAR
ncbi:MAG: hypothetical protein Q9207_006170 [Kuettlingeria erythrocarpa]